MLPQRCIIYVLIAINIQLFVVFVVMHQNNLMTTDVTRAYTNADSGTSPKKLTSGGASANADDLAGDEGAEDLDRARGDGAQDEELTSGGASANADPFTNEESSVQNKGGEKKKKRPNILVILADDVGVHDVVGYYNNCCNVVDMPNLQSLIDKGVTFHDMHSTPLCAPSRYTMLSGNWPHRGVYPWSAWGLNQEGRNQFYGGQRSLAHALKVGGDYRTAMMGKWHLGGGVPGRYNRKTLLSCCDIDWKNKPMTKGPQDIGFDVSYITPEGVQDAPYAFFRNGYLTTKAEDIRYFKAGLHPNANGSGNFTIQFDGEGDRGWDTSEYNKRIVLEAYDFLDEHKANHQDRPFFLYFAAVSVLCTHNAIVCSMHVYLCRLVWLISLICIPSHISRMPRHATGAGSHSLDPPGQIPRRN